MIEFLRDKTKYLKEPYRLRVHVGYVLLIYLTFTARPSEPLFEIGTAGMLIGLLIRAWASGIVQKDEMLAVEGPYSLCRNPLYVGNILIGYGVVLIHGTWWSAGLLTLYLLVFYPFTIRKENRKLKDRFGEQYEEYRNKVPLLVPRLIPYEKLGGWSFERYFYENKDIANELIVLLLWTCPLYRYVGLPLPVP